MTTIVNITTSTGAININNNSDKTINPNTYTPTKACNKCRTIKQLTEFYKNKTKHDGYQSQCKICENKAKKNIIIKIKMIF